MKRINIKQSLWGLLFCLIYHLGFGQNSDSLIFKHYNHSTATQVLEVESGQYAVLTNETKDLLQLDSTDYPAITYVGNDLKMDTVIQLKKGNGYYSYPRSMVEIQDTLYVLYEYLQIIQGVRTCVNLGLLKVDPNYGQYGPVPLFATDSLLGYGVHFTDLKSYKNKLEFMMIQMDSSGVGKPVLVRLKHDGSLVYRKRWSYSSSIFNAIGELRDYEYVGHGKYLLGSNNQWGESYMVADTAYKDISIGGGKPVNLGVWNIKRKDNTYLLFGLADGSAPGMMEHKGRFSFWKLDSANLVETGNDYYKLPDTLKYYADLIAPMKDVVEVLSNGDYLFAGDEFYQSRNQFTNPFSAYTIRRVKPDGTLVWKYSKVDSISGVVAPVTELIACSDGEYLALSAYASNSLNYDGYTLLEKFDADGRNFSISEHLSSESIRIFPNPLPSGEELTVLLSGFPEEKLSIKLYSPNGTEVYSYHSVARENLHRLKLPILSSGEYVLKVCVDGYTYSKVLLVKS